MPQLTELDENAAAPLDEPTIQDGSDSDSDDSLHELDAATDKAGAATDAAAAAMHSPTMEGKVCIVKSCSSDTTRRQCCCCVWQSTAVEVMAPDYSNSLRTGN